MADIVWDTRDEREYKAFNLGFALPKNVTLEALYDDWEGFRILVRDYDKEAGIGILRISFGGRPVANRCMDEGVYPASCPKKSHRFYQLLKTLSILSGSTKKAVA